MKNIIITDSTLRDGNHSVKHTISLDSIKRYCNFADRVGIPIVEVGHGNGLSASSLLIGKCPYSDEEMLKVAKENLKNSKLGIHSIPGIATVDDIKHSIDYGVDVFRIATHCTEATLSKSHIEFLSKSNKEVYGVLMMSALVSPTQLLEQSKNNLGCAVANSLIAVQSGADMVDACIRGFGAGAGNAPLEILIPVLNKSGYDIGIDFKETIKESDNVMDYLIPSAPIVSPINILTGLSKLFSGFEKPIMKISRLYNLEYSSLIFELGNRKLVAGQEDLIIEIAEKLKK